MSSVAVVIPVKDHPSGVAQVLGALPAALRAHTAVVDDGSRAPLDTGDVLCLRHPRNRGYGAAQKTGYAWAMARGYSRVVLLHGDAQYPVGPTLALAEALADADAALGSRFLVDGGAAIPAWRRAGNRLLTGAANRRFGCALSELHTGARAFRCAALRELPLEAFSDDYLFDHQVLAGLLARGRRIAERPVQAVYDDAVQSISFGRSVRYGLGCLWSLARPR